MKRPGLDQLLLAVRHARVDVVLVWACDRLARSTRHFLEVLDEFNRLRVEFVSLRENIDTGGPLGRALITIIGVNSIRETGREDPHKHRTHAASFMRVKSCGLMPCQPKYFCLMRQR